MKEIHIYVCERCDGQYPTADLALACEAVQPALKVGDVVIYEAPWSINKVLPGPGAPPASEFGGLGWGVVSEVVLRVGGALLGGKYRLHAWCYIHHENRIEKELTDDDTMHAKTGVLNYARGKRAMAYVGGGHGRIEQDKATAEEWADLFRLFRGCKGMENITPEIMEHLFYDVRQQHYEVFRREVVVKYSLPAEWVQILDHYGSRRSAIEVYRMLFGTADDICRFVYQPVDHQTRPVEFDWKRWSRIEKWFGGRKEWWDFLIASEDERIATVQGWLDAFWRGDPMPQGMFRSGYSDELSCKAVREWSPVRSPNAMVRRFWTAYGIKGGLAGTVEWMGKHLPAIQQEKTERKWPMLPVPSVAVLSGKGGVGKSTISAALCRELVRDGHTPLYLDLDVQGPSAGVLFGLDGELEVRDGKLIPADAQGVKVLSPSQMVPRGVPVYWHGKLCGGFLYLVLAHLDWTGIDRIVCDMPPGTGDMQEALFEIAPPDKVLLVTLASGLAIEDSERAGRSVRQKLLCGVIENMAEAKEGFRIFGTAEAVPALAERLEIPFLGRLPVANDIDGVGAALRANGVLTVLF